MNLVDTSSAGPLMKPLLGGDETRADHSPSAPRSSAGWSAQKWSHPSLVVSLRVQRKIVFSLSGSRRHARHGRQTPVCFFHVGRCI